MPRYDYQCKLCNADFFIITGINDSRENITCSKCGSKDTKRIFNSTIIRKKEEITQEKSKEDKQKINTHSHCTHGHTHKYGEHCSPEEDYL